jgi:hypothetical protein
VEGGGGGGGGGGVSTSFTSLRIVFDCAYVNQTPLGWECTWCGKSFVGRHSTRALCHVLKMSKNNVGVCRGTIPDNYLKRYKALSLRLSQRSDARKRSQEENHDSVALSQDAPVATLLAQCGVMVSRPPIPTKPSFPAFSVNDGASVTSSYSSKRKSPFPLPSMQPSISASIQNMGDIRKSNNTTLEMAIADFSTARILLIILWSPQGLPALFVCAALLVMIL